MKIGQVFLALRDVSDVKARKNYIEAALTFTEMREALALYGVADVNRLSAAAVLDTFEIMLLSPVFLINVYDAKIAQLGG